MKKLAIIATVIIFIFALGAYLILQNPNFKGAGPAIREPKEKIADLIDRSEKANLQGEPVNFPLDIPEGFRVSVFAKNLNNARVLKFDPQGTLLLSQPSEGRVVALIDRDKDGKSEETKVVVSSLNRPHGFAFKNNKLYIAETDKVSSFDYQNLTAANKKTLFSLPSGGNHFSRTIEFGRDGRLYTTVGSSCNVCTEADERRAAMLVSDDDGSNLKVFAKGLRNTVFFVPHPETGELWGTDMGRDLLGDSLPPEEVNIIKENQDYGWPYCYGNRTHDNNFDSRNTRSCNNSIPPTYEMPAHVAPLGITFIPENGFPREWEGDLLVSWHGSWNSSTPVGYKVVRLEIEDNKVVRHQDFISGWLQGGQASGRPVDVVFDQGGNLFVSDDRADLVYLVTYTK